MAKMNLKAQEPEEPKEEWLTTYADAITLLMAFFVMLLNFSKIDIPAFEEAAAGISDKIGMRSTQTPTELMKIDIEDVVYNMQAEQAISVGTDDKGVVIELASSAFYKPGSAEFRPEATPVLRELSQTLLQPRYRTYVVEVEGHTDDDPISTPLYPSNWELSAGRATRVVRFLIQEGMEMRRLKAAGYAETQPKVPNRTADGKPIPENQSQNRRVLVRVYPMSLEERKQIYGGSPMEALSREAEEKAKEEAPGAAPGAAPTTPSGAPPEATQKPGQK